MIEGRIDDKIKRDVLLNSGMGPFWDNLCAMVEGTCEKVRSHWHQDVNSERSPDDLGIVVRGSLEPNALSTAEFRPEARLHLNMPKRILTVCFRRNGKGVKEEYAVRADLQSQALYLDPAEGEPYSVVGFVETIIAERLLSLDLT